MMDERDLPRTIRARDNPGGLQNMSNLIKLTECGLVAARLSREIATDLLNVKRGQPKN
jgi:hypothetical protein